MSHISIRKIPTLSFDILVLGSGIAACRAALDAADAGADVAVITKSKATESNSYYAQGGIASVQSPDDSFDAHVQDTLIAGAGLCDEAMVRKLVVDGAERVRELIEMGVPFDGKKSDSETFTLEGGHSYPRIIHACGDQTGKAIQLKMLEWVDAHPKITVFTNHFAIDLITCASGVVGCLVDDITTRRYLRFLAKATILCTGGLGRLYRETTNPPVATGDGMALALRAGAVLKDMEFVQFHPTVLYIAGARRFLISESVRGEGGILLNESGKRFMPDYDPRAELAPRDVVSRSIVTEMLRSKSSAVYLDLSPIGKDKIIERFPRIREFCAQFGLDITRDKIPIRPAAHYMMGGVKTDEHASTGVHRLYAAGEAACTGVHGANRLASNSLLEGLVFGREAALCALETDPLPDSVKIADQHFKLEGILRDSTEMPIDIEDIRRSLVSLMWRTANIYREAGPLNSSLNMLSFWNRYSYHNIFNSPAGFELINMLQIGRVIVQSALARTESRGAHQRRDYPDTDDANWNRCQEFTSQDFE